MSKKPERRSITHDPGADASTRIRDARGKPARKWDKKHNSEVATYRIGEELKAAVRELADSLNISPATIVQRFLTYALEAYQRGELNVYDDDRTDDS
jgi:hypothetical protein